MILSKKTFNFFYGMGAAIVILGVLFKLIHLGGVLANVLLTVGMGVEALIFAFSAFDPPEPEYDWARVYPELAEEAPKTRPEAARGAPALSQKLDEMLEEAHFDKELLVKLRTSIEKLQQTAAELGPPSNAIQATQQYEGQLVLATQHMESLNALYNIQLEKSRHFTETLKGTVENSKHLEEAFGKLSDNLSALNQLYGNMLSALNTQTR